MNTPSLPSPDEAGADLPQLKVMQHLSARPETSQRALSQRLGWSLGRTHYLVRALIDKGWVKAQNFRQSENKAAYVYLLTPKGVGEKLRLTKSFLEFKEQQFEALQREIAALKAELGSEATADADTHPKKTPAAAVRGTRKSNQS